MKGPQILINHNGQVRGPFSVPAVIGALRLNRFPSKAPARKVGEEHWRPLEAVLREIQEEGKGGPPPAISARVVRTPTLHQETATASARQRQTLTVAIAGCGLLLIGAILYGKLGAGSSAIREKERSETSAEGVPGLPAGFAIARNQQEAARCAVMIRGSESAGSGSIVLEGGQVFLYTNIHVVCEGEFSVTDYRGNTIQVNEMGEVPKNSPADVIRFPLVGAPKVALTMAARVEIERGGRVFALGDSQGAGVISSSSGTVIGIGPDRIEVDCPIVPGNSGGPIVNADGNLLALASYLTTDQSIWAKGTPQEVRRFGWIPSAQYQWVKISRRDLVNECSLVENGAMTSRLLAAMAFFTINVDGFKFPTSWPEEPQYALRRIVEESQGHPLFEGLLETNLTLAKFEGASSGSSRAKAMGEYNRFLEFCIKYSRDELAEMEKEIESEFWSSVVQERIDSQKKIQKKFEGMIETFSESGEFGNSLSDYLE